MSKRVTLLVASTLLFLVLAGLHQAPLAGLAQTTERTVRVAVGSQPYTMNPHGSDADSNLSIMSNIFEGLLQRGPDGTLKPALATSWERIDELTWRFTLRQGVRFHNGNEFTWEDVKFSLERLRNPEVSEFISFGNMVASVEPVDGDPWVIDVTTTVPVPYFAQNLHQIWIMDKESTEARTPGEVSQEPIGTGPYRLEEWRRGSYIRLVANEDYWGGRPEIKYAEIHPIIEASTRLAAIMSGQVDILQDIPVAFMNTVESNSNLEVFTRPARRAMYLGLNNRHGSPTSDLRVRQAMYMAIDIDTIIERVMFGAATPAAQIPDEPTVGYSPRIERLPYDVERARELMREAGHEDGFTITLSGPNDRYVQDAEIMAAIAAQLARIGITVEVDASPSAVYLPRISENNLDFHLLGWFDGSYDFGRSYINLLHTVGEAGAGELNGTGYSDSEVDAVYAQAVATIDLDERERILQKMNEMAMERVAVIPLHYQLDTYAINRQSGVNFKPRADTWIVFKEVSFQ